MEDEFESALESQTNSIYTSPDDYEDQDDDNEEDEYGLTGKDRAKLLKKAQKCAKECHTYWDDIYSEMEIDWEMYTADGNKQWDEQARESRKGRPMYSINHLPKFVKKIVAETKKNPVGIKLSPRESGDKLKSDIGMGIVRYVEDSCGAKYAYSHALECATIGGLGWFKGSFKKNKIIIKKVKDAFTYFMDPDAEEIDGSDAEYFIGHKKKKQGKTSVDCYEYWWKDDDKVYWAVIEGSEIEDYGEFPGEIIPIFPVFGDDICYRDNRVVKGIIRDLRDPQKIYNYTKSQEIETVALTPKAPIFAKKDVLGENAIRNIQRSVKTPVPVIETKGDPKEILFNSNNSPNIGWATQVTTGAMGDLREISGIYDTALGSESQEISGKAIVAKQQASDAGQYTFTEHLQATIQQCGRWVIGMIEPVLGEQTILNILGEDGKQSVVDLSAPMTDPTTGAPIKLDLNFSDMDISVSSAPAYATRREAGAIAMQDIMTAIPATAQFIADIAVRNLDVPGAEEAANRLKKMLPPELQDNAETPAGMIPQQIADQMMQQADTSIAERDQIIEQMTQENLRLKTELQNQTQMELAKQQMGDNTKISIEEMKQVGEDRRTMMQIEARNQESNKKIAQEAIKTQQVVPDAPKSVSINTTNITPIEKSEPTNYDQLQMSQPFNQDPFGNPIY